MDARDLSRCFPYLKFDHLVDYVGGTDVVREVKDFVPLWAAGRSLHTRLLRLAEESHFGHRVYIAAL